MDTNLKIQELQGLISQLIDNYELLRNPLYLYTWLKACDFRVGETAESIKKVNSTSFKWREAMFALNVEDLQPPDGLIMTFNETTKDGQLILRIDLTDLDPKQCLEEFGFEHCYRLAIWTTFQVEKTLMKHCNQFLQGSEPNLTHETLEKAFKKMIVIFNVSSITFYQARSFQVMKFALDLSLAYIKYFPAPASHAICIKEPILRTKIKIEVHHNTEKWLERIKDQISLSQLPITCGGTKIIEPYIEEWRARQRIGIQ